MAKSKTKKGMTKAQALHYVMYAKLHGEAYITENDKNVYCLRYDSYTNQFSLKYNDGLHWQTIICTWDSYKIMELLQA